MSELAGYFRHARGYQVSAPGGANLEGQGLFKLPGIIDDQQHTAQANFSTNSIGPGSGTAQLSHLSRLDTQQGPPPAQVANHIRPGATTAPHNASPKIILHSPLLT